MAAADGAPTRRVLLPLAHGCEESEVVITYDVLRVAGAQVIVASVEPQLEVVCMQGMKITADKLLGDCTSETYDLIACPGGIPGARNLGECAVLEQLLREQLAAGRLLAAICAAPWEVLGCKGLLEGKQATAHPGFSDKLADQSCVPKPVVVDGTVTTSRGPGTAFQFALSLVRQLYGEEKVKQVAEPLLLPPYIAY